MLIGALQSDVVSKLGLQATTLATMMNGIPLDSGWSPGLSCRSPFAGVSLKVASSYLSRSVSRLGAAWQNEFPDQNAPEATRLSSS